MATSPVTSHRLKRSQPLLPPLENGDRLTCIEFERRYNKMPHLKKAELVEGVVYMASPLRFEPHAEPHGELIGWLWSYKVATPGVRLGDNPTVRLDLDNEPQPDAVLLIDGSAGGQSYLGEDGYIEGAPELVAEIAASSAAIDLGDKLRAYRRNGVEEIGAATEPEAKEKCEETAAEYGGIDPKVTPTDRDGRWDCRFKLWG